MIIDWYEITVEAVRNFLNKTAGFIPELIGALIIFFIGWLIAVIIEKVVAQTLKSLQVNKIFERGSWKEVLEKAELKINVSEFIGAICKWILIIVFLTAAVGVLGLKDFADVLKNVLNYLPKVIISVLIFVVAVILADILEKIVIAMVGGTKFVYSRLAGAIVKWAIWGFTIFVILEQLIPETQIFTILFSSIIQGIVFLIVIAGGIAFGLGGKEIASEILENLRKRIKE